MKHSLGTQNLSVVAIYWYSLCLTTLLQTDNTCTEVDTRREYLEKDNRRCRLHNDEILAQAIQYTHLCVLHCTAVDWHVATAMHQQITNGHLAAPFATNLCSGTRVISGLKALRGGYCVIRGKMGSTLGLSD